MALGIEMLVSTLIKAVGLDRAMIERQAAEAFGYVKGLAGDARATREAIERVEAATGRIEQHLYGGVDLSGDVLFPAYALQSSITEAQAHGDGRTE